MTDGLPPGYPGPYPGPYPGAYGPAPTPDRLPVRSEADAVDGLLRLVVGGIRKTCPTLKIRRSRVWKEQSLTRIAGTVIDDTAELAVFLSALAQVATTVMLDVVCAYDETAALGGREWLEDNATDRELFDALEVMVAASFPFAGESPLRSAVEAYGEQVKGLVMLRLAEYGARLSLALSPRGSSESADSPPTTSPTDSQTSSSSSSGPTGSETTSGQPATAPS